MNDGWMRQISNRTVCDFYYILFYLRVVLGLLILIALFFTFNKTSKISALFYILPVLTLTLVDTLFTFLICDRALISQD